jgi:hypothetical protein
MAKKRMEDMVICLSDELTSMAMGSVKLNTEWRAVNIEIEYLKRAIKAIEQISREGKRKYVVLAILEGYPLCLGDISGDEFSGILIAPAWEKDN